MASRPQSFIELSAALTGLSPVLLRGTGMTQSYLNELDVILPSGKLDVLLRSFEQARLNAPRDREAAILDDPDMGPIARNIMLLWYCGTWNALPPDWHARNGSTPRDTTHVVSPAAYQAGLQWAVVGAHPAGARQQGFGAWSTRPADLAS